MLDQSHNVTDPIESLMNSAIEVQRAYVLALLIDRKALGSYQQENDVIMAHNTIKAAYNSDVSSILAMARLKSGGAIDPIATYREAKYKQTIESDRPASGAAGSGIV